MRRLVFLALCLFAVTAYAQRGGWRRYPEHGCIGGAECRQNGKRITIALDDAPVIGVRFFAHDNIGRRADGKLNVRIDGHTIASYIDIQRNGKVHEYDVDRLRGDKLVIEVANDDEVEVRDIEVLYAARDERGYERRREADRSDRDRERGGRVFGEEGGCIGGSQCGGRRARVEIPLRDRPIRSITFYAEDNVGSRSDGKLRVRVDDHVLEDYIDIHRRGRDYDISGHGRRGDHLVIEPATDDEVVIRHVRIEYERY